MSLVLRPLAGLEEGTPITNQAKIVSDVNVPIWTNVVTNIIGLPSERVYLPLVLRSAP